MNTSLGYSKRTLTDTKVLLSGGGDRALSDFIGSISWDSTEKKLKYTPVGSSDGYVSIGYASSAGSATNANYATSAGSANNASYASLAGYASSAGSANNATNANRATNADYASNSGHASSASSADRAMNANYATSAGSSTYSTYAYYLNASELEGDSLLDCLQDNYSSITKLKGYTVLLVYDNTYALALGGFRGEYETAYGGWFISDLGVPKWVGVNNGTWNSTHFITGNNISTQSVSYAASAGAVAWGDITSKPTLYTNNYLPNDTPHYFRDPTINLYRGGIFWGTGGSEAMSFVVASYGTIFLFVGNSDISLWDRNTWATVSPYLTIASTGTTAVNFYSSSDLRKKNIIDKLWYSSKSFSDIDLVEFEWKDNPGEKLLGVVAQNVEKYIPEVVTETNYKSVNYGVLGTLAGITACREIERLKEEINQLKEKLHAFINVN